MKISELKRIINNLSEDYDDYHVEFHDVTHTRQCPINSHSITKRKSGEKNGEPTFTHIFQLSNKF